MMGEVAILNVGAGDTKLTFDPSKPAEVERSARIVKDMIRSGFVLLIEVGHDEKGPVYRRAHDFDETTSEYIVAGMASAAATEEPKNDEEPASAPRKGREAAPRRTSKFHRVPAGKAKAVAISRTAGG